MKSERCPKCGTEMVDGALVDRRRIGWLGGWVAVCQELAYNSGSNQEGVSV